VEESDSREKKTFDVIKDNNSHENLNEEEQFRAD
jgi:hypothetical protein